MPEADEGLDMGGKRYVKTLLEDVTGVEDRPPSMTCANRPGSANLTNA